VATPHEPRRRAPGPARVRWIHDVATVGVIAVLLAAVTLLPPDTTLAEVRRAGFLRVCLPDRFPPLVTGESAAPGIDVEILGLVADRLGVRLLVARNPSIGRDFNPRNWRVTRAQCLAIAGGVVDSVATRGFLVTTPPHLETGWAAVPRDDLAEFGGARVGFFAGLTGLDRIALSSWLRGQGATVRIVPDALTLRRLLADGEIDVAVTEALTAPELAAALGTRAVWLPDRLGRVPIAFGLWKGDLTLERFVARTLADLRRTGHLQAILDRYELAPIEEACAFCR
jgi:ABC-type amino acid transport substrate-binding protein